MQAAEELPVSRGSRDQRDPVARLDRKALRESKDRLVLVKLGPRAKRASVVSASRPRLVADPPATKCLTEFEATQAHRASKVQLDLQVREPRADRAHEDLLVQ